MNSRKFMLSLIILGLSFCAAQNVSAQSFVIGNGAASTCYKNVLYGDPGRLSTIRTCETALSRGALSKKDEAATYVNLGILHMRAKHYDKARVNYDKALSLRPNLAEAHINRSAVLIYMGEYQKAVETINKAIEIGTTKMPEALFNRAMAYDNLQQYGKAYKDLKRALGLRPNWLPALGAIDNYDVVTRPVSN